MATKKVSKPRNRKVTTSNAPILDNWETLTGEEYHKQLRTVRNYYYEKIKEADLIKYIWTWMKSVDYSKHDIQCAQQSNVLSSIIGINCKLLLEGVPDYNPAHAEYWNSLAGTSADLKPISESIRSVIDDAVSRGELHAQEDTVTEVRIKPTIQDRVTEQSKLAAQDIDVWLSDFQTRGWDSNGFDFRSHFEKHNITAVHAKRIGSFYTNELSEIGSLLSMPTQTQIKGMNEHEAEQCMQLKEGYTNLTKTQIQRYHQALDNVVNECNAFANTKNAVTQKRKFTTRDMAAQVAKLKYCKNDIVNNLTSVNPSLIVGAECLWIYNTKTRKLGCYIAKELDPKGMKRPGTGLGVKGSTIIGYDTDLSVQKTVRKPAETLREFNASNKARIRNFLDKLTTTDTKMNGRINEDIILLRAW